MRKQINGSDKRRYRDKETKPDSAMRAQLTIPFQPDEDRLLRIKSVAATIGMSRAWIYKAIQDNKFPPGVKISARARGWTASSIQRWVEARQAA